MKMTKQLFITLVSSILVSTLFCPTIFAKEVVIGFTGPLSGPAAQYGRDNVAGLKMAIEDINAAGGIKIKNETYTFTLKTYDDHIDPTAAVNNARRLRSRDGAMVIFNPVFNTLAPMMQVNQQRGSEFLLMAYTSTPAIDQIDNDLTISIPPPFDAYVYSFTKLAWDRGWRKGAMVVTLGAYGDEWREAFKAHWTEKGGQISADNPANYYTDTDFSSQISAAMATKPEFMLIGGPSDTTALVIEQARNLGFKGGFILVDQAKMNYIADVGFNSDLSKMNNVIGVARTLDLAPKTIMRPFVDRYKKEYKVPATSENVLNYSAMRMLAAAMVKAGTVEDPKSIKAAFSKILPMDPKENLVHYAGIQETRLVVPATIQVIEDGKYGPPILNIWWAKSDDEFKNIVSKIPKREDALFENTPLKDYLK